MTGAPHYSIDTSALITWWSEDYTPDVFPGLLPLMGGLIAEGRLRAVKFVRDEIKPGDLLDWCKAQPDFFLEDDEDIQIKVRELMATYQAPKKPRGISNADPFVIACAALNGEHWHVVSSASLGSLEKNPSIPTVCDDINVGHVRFFEMLRLEGWKL